MAFHTATGGENHVGYGDNSAWEGNTAMSWAFHINPDTLTNNERILVKEGSSAAATPWVIVYMSTGAIKLQVGDGVGFTGTTSTEVTSTGQDNSVVVIWNGSTVRFIINGVDDGTSALVEVMTTSASELALCGEPGSTASIDGVLEHVMIWDSELTLNEALSYHNGMIPNPSNLVFWQPCLIDTMPDLITGAAASKTGTVAVEDGFTLKIPRFPRHSGFWGIASITNLLKVIDEVEEIPETNANLIGLLKILDEVLEIPETNVDFLGIIQVLDEILQLEDGDGFNDWDPDGLLTETMSDSTVWKTKFPPFVRRTKWTSA